MLTATKNFFKEIQRSEEVVRRRWLIILTGASMIIVLGLWVQYINVVMQSPDAVAVAEVETERPGFLYVFGSGLRVVGSGIKETSASVATAFRDGFRSSREIELEGVDKNFILEGLDPVDTPIIP